MNAIVQNSATMKDCTIYVTLFPCNECAKIIIQSGIKEVVYLCDKSEPEYEASRKMFDMAHVKYRYLYFNLVSCHLSTHEEIQ